MKVKKLIAATEWRPSRRYGLDRPRVSVLLPAFCSGQSGLFLRSARSVLAQSLADLELIVVDDASTDAAADQIRQLMAEDKRVSCLRHPRSVGLPALAAYEAFLKARAEYLLTAFSEIVFRRDAIRDLLAAAIRHGRSIVHGYVETFLRDSANKRKRGLLLDCESEGQAKLRGLNYIPDAAALLQRRVIENVGFYDPHAAMSGTFDWDLWRRAADGYAIMAVPVLVGREHAPAGGDLPSPAAPLDPWQAHEWMETPRNARLRPGAIEQYDVLAAPAGLSREAAAAAQEISATFREKLCRAAGAAARPGGGNGRLAGGDRAADGRLLVVTPAHMASTTLYFEHLPSALGSRVRIAYPGPHGPAEMIGASAVVFVRDVLGMAPWVDCAARMQVPCYYFLDDNFMLLGGLGGQYAYLRNYTDDAVRRRLRGFAGVLLSSRRLIDYFREKGLHSKLLYYPPIARKPAWRDTPLAPPKAMGTMRIATFGGYHRLPAFREQVFPAIAEIARERPVQLFAAAMGERSLPVAENLKVVYLPFEPSYDIALARLAACEIDLLVHPNSDTPNNEYKTCNVLISAWAMGAAPLVSDAPPYNGLRSENVAMLCAPDKRSWREAIRRHAEDAGLRESLRRNLDAFCMQHYGGEENAAAMQAIFASHPAPDAALRDVRRQRTLEQVRRGAVARPPRAFLDGVGRRAARKILDSWAGPAVRRLRHLLTLRPQPQMHDMIIPAFRPLLENRLAEQWLRDGYRLRVSRDLREVLHLDYPLETEVAHLSAVLLAPLPGPSAAGGRIGIEIVAYGGKVLAQSGAALGDVDPSVPLALEFPPVAGCGCQRLWLRVYGKDLTQSLRLLHWSKRRLWRAARGDVRPFCAFRFDAPAAVAAREVSAGRGAAARDRLMKASP
jgi:hypothetical protein